MSTDKTAYQETKEAVMDNEHSIGEKAPGTPFAMVALSYFAMLALACGGITLVMWATR